MTDRVKQAAIAKELQVVSHFDAATEAKRRINFLADYLTDTGLAGYVLGISGGVDSTTTGWLAQLACELVRNRGGKATFVAMRLPYRVQADESDAQLALAAIRPDETITIDIGPASDAMWDQLVASGSAEATFSEFVKGNLKARQRMAAQYAVAGARALGVLGTDQAAEALVGFYTKFGDGAADLTPLTGLPKRRVKQLARFLQIPQALVEKVPTADLESDRPGLPDEKALGVTYDLIDDYLEGLDVTPQAEATILTWYHRSAHKRALPVTPLDFIRRSILAG